MNLFGIESRTTIESAPFMKTNDHDAFITALTTISTLHVQKFEDI